MTPTLRVRSGRQGLLRSLLALVLLAVSALSGGCDGELTAPSLPAAPVLQFEGLDPEAQAQLGAAQAEVLAMPASALANARLARLLHAYAQLQPAATYYHRARSLEPDNMALAHLHGLVLRRIGALDAAIEALRSASDLDPSYVPALLKLAECLADAGETEASRSYYEAALQAVPNLPQALLGLGKLGLTDDPQAALALMRRAASVSGSYGAAHYAIAQVLRDSNDLEGARSELEAFERHRGQAPHLDDPVMDSVRRLNQSRDGHLESAMKALAAGRLETSAREFEKSLEKDPHNTMARPNLIAVYGELGRYDEAEAQYRLGVQSNARDVKLHTNYAFLHIKQKQYAKAIEAYETAIEVDPGYGKPYIGIGAIRAAQGRPDDALRWYRAALENDPANRQARQYLGAALIQRGLHEQSIEVLIPAVIPDDVHSARYLRLLASAQVGAQRYEEAEKSLVRAEELARRFNQADLARAAQQDATRVRLAHLMPQQP